MTIRASRECAGGGRDGVAGPGCALSCSRDGGKVTIVKVNKGGNASDGSRST
jgi:hypothetical protein